MKPRSVYSGVIGSFLVVVPLWLIMYYIWPSRIQEDSKLPTLVEIGGYFITVIFILATGYVSAKWGWAKTRLESALYGGVSGLIIGIVSFVLVGAAGMGLMGNKVILQNFYKTIANEDVGVSYLISSIISTAKWIYFGFWVFLLLGILFGVLGGILASVGVSSGWGRCPDEKPKWLFRLPVYTLVFSGVVNLVVTIAALMVFQDVLSKSYDKVKNLLPASSCPDIVYYLGAFTVTMTFIIPLATTIGIVVAEWEARRLNRALHYSWIVACLLVVLSLYFFVGFDTFGLLTVSFIPGLGICYFVWWISKNLLIKTSLVKYSTDDWAAYILLQGIFGGIQTYIGFVPYALSLVLISITNIPHLTLSGKVDQSLGDQIGMLFSLLASSGLALFILSGVVGLVMGWIILFCRKFFFYEDYLDDIVPAEDLKKPLDGNMKQQDTKKTVFVSYSHADGSFVDRLVDDLKKGNVDVWIDKWMIRVGDSITDKVNEGIGSSDFLIIVLSTSSVNSKWVREEINTALIRNIEQGKQAYILPLLIEDCDLPPLLTHRKYVNFKDNYTRGYLELIETIQYRANN